MSRIARGAITIVDINDGSNPISAALTNQNHTFAANASSVVDTATRDLFETGAVVFIGSTKATLNTDGTVINNQYRIKPVGSGAEDTKILTGSGWAINVNATTGKLTVTTIPSTTAYTCTVQVAVEYKDPNIGTKGVILLSLTLTKVNEGAGGSIISALPDKQAFFADFGGSFIGSNNGDAILVIETEGTPGAQSYQTSQNGNAFATVTTASNSIGGIKGFDTDLTGAMTESGTISNQAQRLLISKENLGTNETLAVKIKGANGGADVVSFIKVRDGETGASAINVALTSSVGGNAFKNNGGSPKTISVVVTDAKDGSALTPTNYQWLRNGTQVNVTDSSNRTVVQAGGVAANGSAFSTIIVGPEDVTDNSSEEYSCIVTVPD